MANPLTRRDFVKTTIAGVASAMAAEAGGSAVDPPGTEKLTLENDQMVWEFSRAGQRLVSSGLRNKLTGRHFLLSEAAEIRLIVSAAKERIEMPWWRCTFGPDNDST